MWDIFRREDAARLSVWLCENAKLFMHEGGCLQQLLGGEELDHPLHSHVGNADYKFWAMGGFNHLQPGAQLCLATFLLWPLSLVQRCLPGLLLCTDGSQGQVAGQSLCVSCTPSYLQQSYATAEDWPVTCRRPASFLLLPCDTC